MGQTESHTRGAWRRWVLAGAAAILALMLPIGQSAAMAAIVPGESVYIGSKQGYGGTGIFPIWSAVPEDLSNPGDPDVWAYCLENQVTAKTGVPGVVGDLGSYLGSNAFTDPTIQGKVLWVLTHGYPAVDLASLAAAAGVSQLSRNDAIEATQYAIWRYTDLDFDAAWEWETEDSEAVYWYLVNGANVSAGVSPADLVVTASVSSPDTTARIGTLVGPYVVHTNQASVNVSVDSGLAVTDAAGTPIDLASVVDGTELYLDLRHVAAGGNATLRVTAAGSGATGHIVSVPNTVGGVATPEDHAQSIILVAPSTATTGAETRVEWAAEPSEVPQLATSLVDAADHDRVLPWDGGTAIDTIAYEHLVPGTEYTVAGELMRKSDGSATGLTGTTTFTPEQAHGSVAVTFEVPEGYAGESLVAFEWLYAGPTAAGAVVAEHTDIADAAQTITVAHAPVVPEKPVTPEKPVVTETPAVPSQPTVDASGAPTELARTGGHGLPIAGTLAGLALVACAVVVLRRARLAG
ncbi:TQXA domain-containing protein [Leucobacter chromiireducens subsp. solipictus]|uniref:TQXA domain-containing protein n=2 Tax=Leucobacter TaxID=55968 RepID=A0ABS1SFV4_9MICO|nr:TQXA domain-containing protein [Leucobacter chromiireducens subsp. solipictus]